LERYLAHDDVVFFNAGQIGNDKCRSQRGSLMTDPRREFASPRRLLGTDLENLLKHAEKTVYTGSDSDPCTSCVVSVRACSATPSGEMLPLALSGTQLAEYPGGVLGSSKGVTDAQAVTQSERPFVLLPMQVLERPTDRLRLTV
jgi:hypothetical protein